MFVDNDDDDDTNDSNNENDNNYDPRTRSPRTTAKQI